LSKKPERKLTLKQLYFRSSKDKTAFLQKLDIINNSKPPGVLTMQQWGKVVKHCDRLQNKLIKRYQDPARLNPNRNSIDYREWRKAILERDNYMSRAGQIIQS